MRSFTSKSVTETMIAGASLAIGAEGSSPTNEAGLRVTQGEKRNTAEIGAILASEGK